MKRPSMCSILVLLTILVWTSCVDFNTEPHLSLRTKKVKLTNDSWTFGSIRKNSAVLVESSYDGSVKYPGTIFLRYEYPFPPKLDQFGRFDTSGTDACGPFDRTEYYSHRARNIEFTKDGDFLLEKKIGITTVTQRPAGNCDSYLTEYDYETTLLTTGRWRFSNNKNQLNITDNQGSKVDTYDILFFGKYRLELLVEMNQEEYTIELSRARPDYSLRMDL